MKKFLCGLLSAALAVSLTVPMAGAAYTDVPSESTLDGEVEKAVRYGLMNGYSDTTFGYGDSMTRAQFAAVLVRMMGWETVTPATADFTDVPVSHTWYGAVETAAAHDVVDEGGAFRPGRRHHPGRDVRDAGAGPRPQGHGGDGGGADFLRIVRFPSALYRCLQRSGRLYRCGLCHRYDQWYLRLYLQPRCHRYPGSGCGHAGSDL